MQRPELAQSRPEAEGAPPSERGVEDILAEAGELLEAKEPTPEEQFEQWQELKADEESARLQLIQAQARLDSPDLDAGLRNLGLALARVGIEARLQAVQTLEGATSDPMAPEAVRSAAAQLQKIEGARQALAAREVPAVKAAEQQRLVKELEERAQRIRSDMAPTLEQLHGRVQKGLAPETAALDAEIAATPELMAARRAAAEAEVGALKERVHGREASRIALTADGKILEQLAAQAGKEARAAAEAQLATPEGRAAFLQSEFPKILKESGILLSPRDADAEYQRRKTVAGGYYPREQFARDLLDDLQRAAGGEGRSYDAQQKYEQRFGGSHARTWETVSRAVAGGLPGEETRDRSGGSSKLYERLRGYTEALALGRGDIEEAQVGKVLGSLQEALGKSLEDPHAAERTIPGIADAMGKREQMRFQAEAEGLAMAQLEAQRLGELSGTAETIDAELGTLRSEASEVTALREQLREVQAATRAFDSERGAQRQTLESNYGAAVQAAEGRMVELRQAQRTAEARKQQLEAQLRVHGERAQQLRASADERRRALEVFRSERVFDGGYSRADVTEGRAQIAVQGDIAKLDEQIADREAKKPKLFGRKEAEAEIQRLRGDQQRLEDKRKELDGDAVKIRDVQGRMELELKPLDLQVQEAEAALAPSRGELTQVEAAIAKAGGEITGVEQVLADARRQQAEALATFDGQTQSLRQEVLRKFGGESIRARTDAIDQRMRSLTARFTELLATADRTAKEQPESPTLHGERDRIRNESVVLQAARDRFGATRDRLGAFLSSANNVLKGRGGQRPGDRETMELLGIS